MKQNKEQAYIVTTQTFIPPPDKIPLFIRLGVWLAERKTRKQMLVPRILAWYPKAALSSGVLEALITHQDKQSCIFFKKRGCCHRVCKNADPNACSN